MQLNMACGFFNKDDAAKKGGDLKGCTGVLE